MRADPGPLLLMGLVVALTTALTSAATPLIARTSDRALAEAVRQAGDQGAVVATFARAQDDFGPRIRDPQAAGELRAAVAGAQYLLPKPIAAVVESGITSVTTTPLQLTDAGPGRYLTLAYLDDPRGAPGVDYAAGGPPRATVTGARARTELPADAPPWPVQVALSQATASALGLRPGDPIEAKDDKGRTIVATVSGVFTATDPSDRVWQTTPQLLHPAEGVSAGHRTAAAAALVSSAALPDLRLAVPSTDLTERIVASPRPDALRWVDSGELVQALAALKASPELGGGTVSWDTTLDRVLTDGRAQVSAARGQADVLLTALLICALLVLWQAADLLVRRRAHSIVLTRERGGNLAQIAAELFLEAVFGAAVGAALGLALTSSAVGGTGWGRWVLLPLLAALAAAASAAVLASRSTDPRRIPANRSARRAAARARRLLRVLLVLAVVAGAALSFVALRQRGVVGVSGAHGGPAAASAPTWWALAGALLFIAALPAFTGRLVDVTRRASGSVAFVVAARVRETGTRALPLLVVMVTVAQLTFALALTSTERGGQVAGALSSVGGDARATLAPGASATTTARQVAAADGVRAAVAARVEDGVRATARTSAGPVRLVVVDAAAYAHLLA